MPGVPVDQISTLKPGGSLSLFSGISEAGVTVFLPATGASRESAMLAGRPCCQAGGCGAGVAAAAAGCAGLAWGVAGWLAQPASKAASKALAQARVRFMGECLRRVV